MNPSSFSKEFRPLFQIALSNRGLYNIQPETEADNECSSFNLSVPHATSRAHLPSSAGGLMNAEVLSVRPDVSVDVVLRYLRMQRPLPAALDALFVVDRREHFLGAIPLERLATAQLDELAGELLAARTPAVAPGTPAHEVAQLFADLDLTSLAVVGRNGRLLGRITSDDVVDVMRDEAEIAMRRMGHLSAGTDFLLRRVAHPGAALRLAGLWPAWRGGDGAAGRALRGTRFAVPVKSPR